MRTISEWPEFLSAVQPYLTSARPLDALRQANVELGGAVAAAFANRQPSRSFTQPVIDSLVAEFGPPPAARLGVGRRARDVRDVRTFGVRDHARLPRQAGGYGAVVSARMQFVNDVLAELWRVGTIPQEFTVERTKQLITIDDLRQYCTGVPDGADVGGLRITAAPTAMASSLTHLNGHLMLPIELPLTGVVGASLVAMVEIDMQLLFTLRSVAQPDTPVSKEEVCPSSDAYTNPFVVLTVASSSTVRPSSDAGQAALAEKIKRAIGVIVLFLGDKLCFSGDLTPSPSQFPNSAIRITDIGAATVRQADSTSGVNVMERRVGGTLPEGAGATGAAGSARTALGLDELDGSVVVSGVDFVNFGLLVDSTDTGDAASLAGIDTPSGSSNLRALIDQDFANDALTSVIKSGDLAAFFNRIIARHDYGLNLASMAVNSGNVTFDNNLMTLVLDCTAVDACTAHKDLGFTATVSGPLVLSDGQLTFQSSEVDFDLDDLDALACTLLSGLTGPFGILINAAVLAFIAAYNPDGKDESVPASFAKLLPGSEKDALVSIDRVSLTPGLLTVAGTASVVDDLQRLFVYLRVVSGEMSDTPIADATVELIELDSPAPSGDDVAVPAAIDSDVFTPKYEITEVGSYTPHADESLGKAVTDDAGLVSFAVVANAIGGILTDTKTTSNIETGNVVSSTTKTEIIGEASPDVGVTITAADGTLLATRIPVAVNVAHKRVGALGQPVTVRVGRTIMASDVVRRPMEIR